MTQGRGVMGKIGVQYEETFGADPGTPDLTKLYFETEGLKSSRNLISSKVMTGDRFTTKPTQGNIDVSGNIQTELGAYPGILFYAAAGSIKTEENSGSGEALGSALTTPTAVISAPNQTITITSTAHGLAVGDVVKIEGITAPTDLNDTYLRVMSVTSADIFVCRIPLGVSGTFTLGAGSVKEVTTAATTYKHTMAFGGKLPSLVIEKGLSDISQYFKYNGMVVSGLSLNHTPEGFETLSFNFVGQKETPGTSSFDSTATDLGKSSFDGFGVAVIEEGGGAIANITKLDFNIDNSLDAGQYVTGGAGLRNSIPEGKVKITGTLEALFENQTLYTKAVNSTETSIKIEWNIGTGAGTDGNESFELYLPELIYSQNAPVISGEGGVMVSLPFEAYYDNASEATSAQIILLSAELSI